MMISKMILPVLILTLVYLINQGHSYDEAGCAARSNETYLSGINAICKLPLGVHQEDNDYDSDRAPFEFNRCDKKEGSKTKSSAAHTVYGVLAALLASFMFGSMFLPVKYFDTGDGMFFQWLMAIGAFLVGLVFHVSMWPQPPFFSFAMTGGILWACGNVLTIPTLKLIGIGMTQTMVGISNAIGGWISGRFILCQPLKSEVLNTVGVVIMIISAILLSFVGSDGRKKNKKERNTRFSIGSSSESSMKETSSAINNDVETNNSKDTENTPLLKDTNEEADRSWVDKLGKWRSRIIGLSMALCSGMIFGFQFLPVEFIRNCDNDAFPCEELDYVFAQYVGIFLCSTFWFIVYCCFKKFNPQVYNKLIVPGITTGVMFGIGTAMWFLSNKYVGLPVAFPIITSGSGIVGSAWGIIVFREIKGRFNVLMFVFAVLVVITGIVLVGLSH